MTLIWFPFWTYKANNGEESKLLTTALGLYGPTTFPLTASLAIKAFKFPAKSEAFAPFPKTTEYTDPLDHFGPYTVN